MNPKIFLQKKAELEAEANTTHNHIKDRIAAWMDLGFLYGQDYHQAYKCFRKAQDLINTK